MADKDLDAPPLDDQDENFKKVEEVDPRVLNAKQINFCREMIAKKHPLRHLPLVKVWPWLKIFSCCMKKPKKNFGFAIKKALRRKMDIQLTQHEIEMEANPFLEFGFGINAYFNMIKSMLYMMIVIFILNLPLLYIYTSYDAHRMDAIASLSLGNMGGSLTICQHVPNNIPNAALKLKCSSGMINIDARGRQHQDIIAVGIVPADQLEIGACNDEAFPDPYNCTQYLQYDAMMTAVKQSHRHVEFSIENINSWNYRLPTPDYATEQQCFGRGSQKFVQIACDYTDEEVKQRKTEGLFIGCICITSALFITVFCDYLEQISKNKLKWWDVRTITASDYTVEMEIKNDFYLLFLETDFAKDESRKNIPMVVRFREWLIQKIEHNVSQIPDQGFESPAPDKVRVVSLSFAYNNAPLIKLLKSRGEHIKAQEWKKVEACEAAINVLKNTQMEQLTRPRSAFITFRTEEGYQRAIKFKSHLKGAEKGSYKWRMKHFVPKHSVKFEPASEPSDIIWENRSFTKRERRCRRFIVILALGLALIIAYIIMFYGTKWQFSIIKKFPPQAPGACDDFTGTYGAELEHFAILNYKLNSQRAKKWEIVMYSGHLQCFCNQQDQLGVPSDFEYGHDQLPICEEFNDLGWLRFLADNVVTIGIVVLNIILTKLSVALQNWVGFASHSEVYTRISISIFTSVFFNTAVVILLANANLSAAIPPLAIIFNGYFDDYSFDWYKDVGNIIVISMLVNCFVPAIEFWAECLIYWYGKRNDQKWVKDRETARYTTKCTQVMAYMDIHCGPDHEVHVKYAEVLNVVFVTVMYGPALPILYVIAVVHYFIYWNVARYSLVYKLQMPPSMDYQLTKNCIQMLKWAPLLYLFNAYWLLSNKQIFHGWVNARDSVDAQMPSGHNMLSSLTVNQAAPVLMIAFTSTVIYGLQKSCKRTMQQFGFRAKNKEIDVDQDLPNFFKAVKISQADWLVAESDYYRKEYNLKLIPDEMHQKLVNKKTADAPIQGSCWYNILSNKQYIQDFAYISPSYPDRNLMINDDDHDESNDCEQSDMVQIILNLALLDDEFSKTFTFEKGIKKKLQEHMQKRVENNLGDELQAQYFDPKRSKTIQEPSAKSLEAIPELNVKPTDQPASPENISHLKEE